MFISDLSNLLDLGGHLKRGLLGLDFLFFGSNLLLPPTGSEVRFS